MAEQSSIKWTNASVRHFAGERDPVQAMMERAREVVTKALDDGWTGPPFDLLALADLLAIRSVASEDVFDARTVSDDAGRPLIEYNPTRPRGRVRYSLAHEIAHTLFEDWADRVRHRSPHNGIRGDEWQLEALCNIGAAEFVMPIGTFRDLASSDLTIDVMLKEQKRFDVSLEAVVIRTVHLRDDSCAMFCASRVEEGALTGRYRVDYVIGSRAWDMGQVSRGVVLPKGTSVADCIAIGYSAKGNERWGGSHTFRVECVGIAPYPGSTSPRVVGFLQAVNRNAATESERVEHVLGDATSPRGAGSRMLVQVVTDAAMTWGGGGFAAAVRRAWPAAQEAFRDWAMSEGGNLALGRVHFADVGEGLTVASIVAQHGYGPSAHPRIRYQALLQGLRSVTEVAVRTGATVHMPRIGSGMAGGNWELVEELVQTTLLSARIPVTVYDRPGVTIPAGKPEALRLL